jgi:formate dehydrogenase assembly factor FdhD
MKDSVKRFRAEKINDRALLPTPENLPELAVGFMLSEGRLRENKPAERIEGDPEGEGCVRVNSSEKG